MNPERCWNLVSQIQKNESVSLKLDPYETISICALIDRHLVTLTQSAANASYTTEFIELFDLGGRMLERLRLRDQSFYARLRKVVDFDVLELETGLTE